MSDLITTQTPAKRLSLSDLRMSEPLWTRLHDGSDEALASIAGDGDLHAEAKALVPSLEAICAPCGADFVKEVLAPLVIVFGVGEAAKSSVFWAVYFRVLHDLPADALRAAVLAYTAKATSEFFPRPGPLRDLALKAVTESGAMLATARKAARMSPPKVVTDEERAQVRSMLAEGLGTPKAMKP